MKKRFTPERITELNTDEIFVFGSNLSGFHSGGAARTAWQQFGAIWGQGVGLQGRSYAIPTMQGSIETIKPYTDEFIRFARAHQELTFYVTRIGCGIAGFTDTTIAPLFHEALEVENILLPHSFVACLAPASDEIVIKGFIGAVIGDIVGSRFEGHNLKSTEFELFTEACKFTDDTVMTLANADWLLNDDDLTACMLKWGKRYPHRGYGGRFRQWLYKGPQQPYNSFGNGSGMRVSPVGFYAETLDETLALARQSAEVTHNHPEGIKGAQAIAAAVFLARTGKNKQEIRASIERMFGYDLHHNCDEIRPTYRFDVTCQGSCPEAIIAFLDSRDYESALRLAVSLGGDSDTIACMAGGIAAAYYGVPSKIVDRAMSYLTDDIRTIIARFDQKCASR